MTSHKSGALPAAWYRMGYHVVASNAAKLIAGILRNPRDWRIEDLAGHQNED
jgi:hypothetical protein